MKKELSHAGSPSRRSVAIGAAWSVPVIAAAIAAPAASASRTSFEVSFGAEPKNVAVGQGFSAVAIQLTEAGLPADGLIAYTTSGPAAVTNEGATATQGTLQAVSGMAAVEGLVRTGPGEITIVATHVSTDGISVQAVLAIADRVVMRVDYDKDVDADINSEMPRRPLLHTSVFPHYYLRVTQIAGPMDAAVWPVVVNKTAIGGYFGVYRPEGSRDGYRTNTGIVDQNAGHDYSGDFYQDNANERVSVNVEVIHRTGLGTETAVATTEVVWESV